MADAHKNGLLQNLFKSKVNEELPLIPLRDIVVFPKVAVPLVIQRSRSLKALDFAEKHHRVAVFVAQKEKDQEDPKSKEVFKVGTISKVKEIVRDQDGQVRALIEGISRVKIVKFVQESPFLKVKIEPLPDVSGKKTEKVQAAMYNIINQFKQVVSLGATVPLDVMMIILNLNDPWQVADLITLNLDFSIAEKQKVLEAKNIEEKIDLVRQAMARQIKVMNMAKKIQDNTGSELSKMQKEVYLREQLKAIEKELGVLSGQSEEDDYKEQIAKAGMPKEVKKVAEKELARLQGMPSVSPEVGYIKTYLDWLIGMPWNRKSKTRLNIKTARKILDQDHYGLDKVKERITEFLAVQKLVGKIKGPILCFAGPPGTGKTSIGKSIAKSMGRKFVRVSLGGIRDEAEIRGHRRTYVGALPGRIIQGVKSVDTKNPVFMLDEIDKVGADFRGDPSSALLEALDPEQNYEFSDHYLEVPFDLSDVMFITTANILDTIPPALRDRMEVIDFPGYVEEEKFHIAEDYLLPKQLKLNGLTKRRLKITEPAMRTIIREYTREAGVRELERQISAICRKVAKQVASGQRKTYRVTLDGVKKYLGAPKYHYLMTEKRDEVGVATGLAWTQAGGEILSIEATKMPGKGNLILTGHLGKVMKESAQAAYTYARSRAKSLNIKDKFHQDCDLHVHVPAGAIPKDGPSAGVAIATAIVSVLTQRPTKRTVGMTGEVTLRGKVLEIGGVKEKVLAAHRAGVKIIILPKDNKKDLEEIPSKIRRQLKFVFAESMDQVIPAALDRKRAAAKIRLQGQTKNKKKSSRTSKSS